MSSTRRSLVPLAAAVLTAGAVLSGCGVAGSEWHPGAAAQIDGTTISVSRVNTVASDYCTAIEDQLTAQQQVVPMRYLRQGVAGQLALLEAAKQFADEKGVEPGTAYQQKVADLQKATAKLPEDQQQAVIEMESAGTYISGVITAVGEQQLGSGTAPQKAAQAGGQEFSAWLDDQDISIDPQFGVEIEDGQAVRTDTGVSYALSDAAKAAEASQPDPSYAAQLPDSQRCG